MPSPLAPLAAALSLTEDEILELPKDFLLETLKDLGLPRADQAAILLVLTRNTQETAAKGDQPALEKYFTRRDESRLFPWKVGEQRALLQAKHAEKSFGEADGWTKLRASFVAAAKAGLLTPLEVVVGQYIGFASNEEYGRFALLHLLLHVPAHQRLHVHNWSVAQMLPEALKEANGAIIEQLTVPLFPPIEQLQQLNTKLMAEATQITGITGGGSVTHLYAQRDPDIWGGGYLPIIQRDGATMLETTALEESLLNLHQRLQQLQQTHQQLQQQQLQHQPQFFNQGRGRGSERGRGQGRGGQYRGQNQGYQGYRGNRGGDRGPWMRGGATEEEQPATKNENGLSQH
jgi:hypothetical protein